MAGGPLLLVRPVHLPHFHRLHLPVALQDQKGGGGGGAGGGGGGGGAGGSPRGPPRTHSPLAHPPQQSQTLRDMVQLSARVCVCRPSGGERGGREGGSRRWRGVPWAALRPPLARRGGVGGFQRAGARRLPGAAPGRRAGALRRGPGGRRVRGQRELADRSALAMASRSSIPAAMPRSTSRFFFLLPSPVTVRGC